MIDDQHKVPHSFTQTKTVEVYNMLTCYVLILTIIGLVISSSSSEPNCPCSNSSLCNNIQANYSKELYGFIRDTTNVSIYNWTYLTAIAVNEKYAINNSAMDNLMCTAHSHGARMILWNFAESMPFTDNVTVQMDWIKALFDQVSNLSYDGFTFDYEGEMLWNQPQSAQYVSLVNLTTQYFHDNLPGSTISVCVPFSAYLEWDRQYDYYNLALVSDYLYIMDYDVCHIYKYI